MKTIKEWDYVQELMEMLEEIESDGAVDFIQDLFDNLDPHSPFLEQQSERQLDWLTCLWEFHCNGNEEAFEDWDAA